MSKGKKRSLLLECMPKHLIYIMLLVQTVRGAVSIAVVWAADVYHARLVLLHA